MSEKDRRYMKRLVTSLAECEHDARPASVEQRRSRREAVNPWRIDHGLPPLEDDDDDPPERHQVIDALRGHGTISDAIEAERDQG